MALIDPKQSLNSLFITIADLRLWPYVQQKHICQTSVFWYFISRLWGGGTFDCGGTIVSSVNRKHRDLSRIGYISHYTKTVIKYCIFNHLILSSNLFFSVIGDLYFHVTSFQKVFVSYIVYRLCISLSRWRQSMDYKSLGQ